MAKTTKPLFGCRLVALPTSSNFVWMKRAAGIATELMCGRCSQFQRGRRPATKVKLENCPIHRTSVVCMRASSVLCFQAQFQAQDSSSLWLAASGLACAQAIHQRDSEELPPQIQTFFGSGALESCCCCGSWQALTRIATKARMKHFSDSCSKRHPWCNKKLFKKSSKSNIKCEHTCMLLPIFQVSRPLLCFQSPSKAVRYDQVCTFPRGAVFEWRQRPFRRPEDLEPVAVPAPGDASSQRLASEETNVKK